MSALPLSQRTFANAIRALAMDAVQQANSGHPGAPMGMADIAEALWREFLIHDPVDPAWPDRDRFVLSNGHGSMLLYALLHLTGYDLGIEDIKQFRQLHARTPGHPEFGYTPGVETTTGPLGQGLANAVGMALAEKTLAAQFNRPGHEVINHRTWVFLGDGCLMEGISHEASSLAGTLQLGKLTAIYDDNGISIDGDVEGWFTEDTAARFKAYGWHVIGPMDGHDREALLQAMTQACAETKRPSLIIARTVIGAGAPTKQGTESCHGSPLGREEIAATRQAMEWSYPPFEVPETIYRAWDAREKGAARHRAWEQRWQAYQQAHPDLARELQRRWHRELPQGFDGLADAWLESVLAKAENIASRKSSQNALDALGPLLPELLGGSADLAGSNLTLWKGSRGVQNDAAGNYVHYGVREFGMSAIMNGVALHGGFVPYGATFLVFMEYARNAVRMAALMGLKLIHVYTHDSIGLGEDGPTHQPVEQLTSLRTTPGLSTWRPADATECAVAWRLAVERQGPTALVLSRQNLAPVVTRREQLAEVARGGYILSEATGSVDAIILATGSEVQLALAAQTVLTAQGRGVRVVSMPSCETFLAQDAAWQEKVLPRAVRARVAVEAAHTDYWYRFVGLDGHVIGMHGFGESAPAPELYQHFGITVEAVVAAVLSL
ncbi:MAG: transketolase [Pseudomonadales bacterium]|nr:transketolase [Pseudomonadales bacterium]